MKGEYVYGIFLLIVGYLVLSRWNEFNTIITTTSSLAQDYTQVLQGRAGNTVVHFR